jgi:hypothetical protein
MVAMVFPAMTPAARWARGATVTRATRGRTVNAASPAMRGRFVGASLRSSGFRATRPDAGRPKHARRVCVAPRAVPPGGGLAVPAPATNLPTSYFSDEKTEAQASRNDQDIPPPPSAHLKDVMPYLYKISVAQPGTALRLAFAVLFMLVQKSTGLAVPILFKTAVDHLTAAAVFSSRADAAGVAAALTAAAMAIVYSGAFKATSGVATELRSVAFTPVAQAAGRRVALQVFNHVLNLDLSFHLNRRTGALQRIIDRGTRSVTMVFRAVVFTFAPTALELTLVCGLLWRAFSWHVVAIVLATFVAYVAWTVQMTGYSADLRKIANAMDGETTARRWTLYSTTRPSPCSATCSWNRSSTTACYDRTTKPRSAAKEPRARSTRGKP